MASTSGPVWRLRAFARGLLLLVTSVAATATAMAVERSVVHILARGLRTTVALVGDRVLDVLARDPTTGKRVSPPGDILEDPEREIWIVEEDRKTRIRYRLGRERDRRTWDRRTGSELSVDRHLMLPASLASGKFPMVGSTHGSVARPTRPSAPAALPTPTPAPEIDSGEGSVGAVTSAEDLFGESLGGLLPEKGDRPTPLAIHGLVEVLLMGGEDGPSPHVLDTGLAGNRALEVKQGIFDLDASLGDQVRFFGQIRAVRFNRFDMRIAMLQIGNPENRHLRIGRQVHPFGTFPLRNLPDRNPLYGYPLAYSYRSSLRPDQVPAGAAGILAARGSGSGQRGMAQAGPALYQTYALYVTPVGKRGQATVGLMNGALSNNENVTSNDAFGFVANLSVPFDEAFRLGASLAVAPYMNAGIGGLAAGEKPEDMKQTLIGLDLGYSRGAIKFESELVWSDWDVSQAAGISDLGSFSWYLEGVWALGPRLYLAARHSALSFDRITSGGTTTSWDFDTDRTEIGVGYRPSVNLLAKLSGQHNETATNPDPDDDALVAQLIGKF